MSFVTLAGNPSGSGTLTIAAPNTNSNRALALPDASGTFALQENMLGASGQRWQAVARTSGVAYNNDTGRPIVVNAWDTSSPNLTGYQNLIIDIQAPGFAVVRAAFCRVYMAAEASSGFVSAVIPAGHSYTVTILGSFNSLTVAELR